MDDTWAKNLLWLIIGLAGLLAAYMLYAHQLICWQRKRGLLARQSHGLYWTVLGLSKMYQWIIGVIILVVIGGALYTSVASRSPTETRLMPKQPQTTAGDASGFDDLKEWILRLEDRRLENPQDYCSRIQRGVTAFQQAERPPAIIQLKLRYLLLEDQKHCSAMP